MVHAMNAENYVPKFEKREKMIKRTKRGIHKLSYEIMIKNVLKEFIEVKYSVIEI